MKYCMITQRNKLLKGVVISIAQEKCGVNYIVLVVNDLCVSQSLFIKHINALLVLKYHNNFISLNLLVPSFVHIKS